MKFKIKKDSVEPVYRQLKRQIADKIDSGELPPGARVPAVREISRSTGISCGTVAKAIAELTRDSYLCGRGCKGLTVSARNNMVIGIISPVRDRKIFSDPHYQQIMAGIEQGLHGHDYSLVIRTVCEQVEHTFSNIPVDGVLAIGGGMTESRSAALIRWSRKLSVMVIGARIMPPPGLSFVIADNVSDAKRVVECLVRAGHRRIAGFFHFRQSARLEGYRQGLAEAGIEYDEQLVVIRDDSDDLEGEAARVAALRPAAVFDSLGNVFWPLMKPKWPANAPMPAVATYHKLLCEDDKKTLPHLLVRQPLHAMGAAAAERLLDMIKSRERKVVQLLLPSEISGNI